MKDIIVFNGIHGAGKSTLARELSGRRADYLYFSEIGGQLRNEVGYNALQSGDEFDREVMRRELQRDEELLQCPGTPIVETWHIGNIGYAATRSPRVSAEYLREFDKALKVFRPKVFLIEIGWNTFRNRASERIGEGEMPQLEEFYRNIFDRTKELYNSFGIEYQSVMNEGPVGYGVETIEHSLAQGIMLEGVNRWQRV